MRFLLNIFRHYYAWHVLYFFESHLQELPDRLLALYSRVNIIFRGRPTIPDPRHPVEYGFTIGVIDQMCHEVAMPFKLKAVARINAGQ